MHERLGAGRLPFVLLPKIHARETLPTPAAQLAEVVQLKHAARAEDLKTLLGKALVAVGQVMDAADRAIGKLQCQNRLVVPNRQRRMATQRDRVLANDRRARQVPKQVDEMAAFADNAAAADGLVLRPMVSGNGCRSLFDCIFMQG